MREKGQTEVAKTLETPVFSRGIEILTEKTGFTQHMTEDGATEVMQIVVDLETGKWEGIHTTKKILKKEQCLQKSDFGDIIPQNNQCNE